MAQERGCHGLSASAFRDLHAACGAADYFLFHHLVWAELSVGLVAADGPYTTLAWIGAMVFNNHQLAGPWIVVLVIAVVMDLGGQGGSARRRREA